jgi:hypothetical protein
MFRVRICRMLKSSLPGQAGLFEQASAQEVVK